MTMSTTTNDAFSSSPLGTAKRRGRKPRRRDGRTNVFASLPVELTDHEAYALTGFMQAVSRMNDGALAFLLSGKIPVGEERRALSSACERVAGCLAANGWDVG